VQVLIAIGVAVVFGYLNPTKAIAMKPLGDGFIRLITMVISLIIFCTVVSGIASMQDMKKVGRVGGKALLYFEVVSTLALIIGMVVGNVVHPGAGFNVNAANLDAKAVADYAGQAKSQNIPEFILHIIPTTVVDAFAKGDILQVVFVALLFGLALSALGDRCKPLVTLLDSLTQAVFGVVNILMRFAPLGAFGAMAFTVGKYGIASLGPLAKLIGVFYLTCIFFVLVVLGIVSWLAGFNIIKFLLYIKEEVLLVLAISSSEPAIPTLMVKLEKLGCSKALVGLIVPTGYTSRPTVRPST
jgi:aerobic C4-dicarboxylate transport protein